MKNEIIIQDWTGKILFQGNYKDKTVDKVLDANRCKCGSGCKSCDESGYSGDFEVYWTDGRDARNVYEFINY